MMNLKNIFFKIAVCLLLVCLVAGCSSYENDTERILGKWVGKVDFGESAGIDKEILLEIELEFNSKGVLTSSYNPDKMVKAFKKPLTETIKSDLKMTIEEWEKQIGVSLEEYIVKAIEPYKKMLEFTSEYSLKGETLKIDGVAVGYEFDGDDTLKLKKSPFEDTSFKRK